MFSWSRSVSSSRAGLADGHAEKWSLRADCRFAFDLEAVEKIAHGLPPGLRWLARLLTCVVVFVAPLLVGSVHRPAVLLVPLAAGLGAVLSSRRAVETAGRSRHACCRCFR